MTYVLILPQCLAHSGSSRATGFPPFFLISPRTSKQSITREDLRIQSRLPRAGGVAVTISAGNDSTGTGGTDQEHRCLRGASSHMKDPLHLKTDLQKITQGGRL